MNTVEEMTEAFNRWFEDSGLSLLIEGETTKKSMRAAWFAGAAEQITRVKSLIEQTRKEAKQ